MAGPHWALSQAVTGCSRGGGAAESAGCQSVTRSPPPRTTGHGSGRDRAGQRQRTAVGRQTVRPRGCYTATGHWSVDGGGVSDDRRRPACSDCGEEYGASAMVMNGLATLSRHYRRKDVSLPFSRCFCYFCGMNVAFLSLPQTGETDPRDFLAVTSIYPPSCTINSTYLPLA